MLLKKILIGIPLVVLVVVGLIGGKMYLEEKKIVSIVKSDNYMYIKMNTADSGLK